MVYKQMKRKILSLLLIFVVIMCANNCAFGDDDHDHDHERSSFVANLIPDKSIVKRDEFVTFTLRLSDIDVEGGISKFVALLTYDSNVLSLASDMFAKEGWTLSYISGSRRFVISRDDPVTEDCDIATVKFKVNYNAIVSSTEVDLLSPSAGNSTIGNAVKISDIRQDISIDLATEPTTSPTPKPTSSSTIAPTVTPTTSPTVSPTVKPSTSPNVNLDGDNSNKGFTGNPTNNDSTTANEDLPKAGAWYVIPLMIFFGIIVFIAFRSYRNIDK